MWNVRTLSSRINATNAGMVTIEGDKTKTEEVIGLMGQHGRSLYAQSETRWCGEGTFVLNYHLVVSSAVSEEVLRLWEESLSS